MNRAEQYDRAAIEKISPVKLPPPILLLGLSWGIVSGLGLRFTVPLMGHLPESTLLLLCLAIPLMFFPSVLMRGWCYPWKAVLGIQLGIGGIAALLSGHYGDTLLSYLLLAVLSIVIIYPVEQMVSPGRKRLFWVQLLALVLFTSANVYGHGLLEGSYPLPKIIAASATGFIACFLISLKLIDE